MTLCRFPPPSILEKVNLLYLFGENGENDFAKNINPFPKSQDLYTNPYIHY